MLSWRRHRNEGPRPSGPEESRDPRASRCSSRIRAQALFYEFRPETILVDCVVLDGRGSDTIEGLSTGLPFSFEVGMPSPAWMRTALTSLERWTSTGAPLELEPRITRQGPRLLVSDAGTVVRFDLDALLIG